MERSVESRDFEPDVAIPPGETLKESIDALGMTQVDLATRMGRPLKTINEIIHGKTAITPETAVQLEFVLGVPARFWLRLEMDYRRTRARIEADQQLAKEVSLLGRFPYAEMAKYLWVKDTRDKRERVSELLSFFRITSLETLSVIEASAFRKSTRVKASPEALSAWLRRGEIEAQELETSHYDRRGFRQALLEIRKLTRTSIEDATEETQRLCAENGVAVIFVPHLKKTYVNGATRWLTPNTALIQLSIRYRYEDVFWFTFFHECGHIWRHGKKQQFIDVKGEEKSWQELEADAFARDLLIPPTPYRKFSQRSLFSRAKVKAFAKQIEISPSVVVGRLQHDEILPQTHLNDLRRRLVWADEATQAS